MSFDKIFDLTAGVYFNFIILFLYLVELFFFFYPPADGEK